jgi:4a-hydroxytetrahydrobiopterin dehydratase
MSDLTTRQCQPCRANTPALKGDDLCAFLRRVEGWSAELEHHLAKVFRFPDFVTALAFVNRIGAIAEQEAHHPEICLEWGKVGVEIYTHSISGLSENDFILAAKIDAAL